MKDDDNDNDNNNKDTDDTKVDEAESIAVIVPPLGESVSEATLYEWKVRTGDRVKRNQPIVHLALDKIDVELEAPATGVIVLDDNVKETVRPGDVLGQIVPPPTHPGSLEEQHAELLATIVAAPDDEGVRQVYADFLLEVGEPIGAWGAETVALRGEYLSLVMRAKRPGPDDDAAALAKRRAQLEDVAKSTALSLVPDAGSLEVQDGFVAGWRVDLATLIGVHEQVFAHAPLRSLEVSHLAAGAADALLALPRLEHLRSLKLVGAGNNFAPLDESVVRLVTSPRLASLQTLELHSMLLGDAEMEAVAQSPAPHIGLVDCRGTFARLGDRSYERLEIVDTEHWSGPFKPRAKTLVLEGRDLPSELDLSHVERLELSAYVVDVPRAIALFATAHSLGHLAVECGFHDDAGVLAFVDALPKQLAELSLRGSRQRYTGLSHPLQQAIRERTAAVVSF